MTDTLFRTPHSLSPADRFGLCWSAAEALFTHIAANLAGWGEGKMSPGAHRYIHRMLTTLEGRLRRLLVLLALSCTLPACEAVKPAARAARRKSKPMTRAPRAPMFRLLDPATKPRDPDASEFAPRIMSLSPLNMQARSDMAARLNAARKARLNRPRYAADFTRRIDAMAHVFANPGQHTGRMARLISMRLADPAKDSERRNGPLRWSRPPGGIKNLWAPEVESQFIRANADAQYALHRAYQAALTKPPP